MTQQNPEFALHVHKKIGISHHQALYTIGIWAGPTLYAICHVQPLDQAVKALREVLDQAGRPEIRNAVAQRNGSLLAAIRTGLRRAATIFASVAGFIRPVR